MLARPWGACEARASYSRGPLSTPKPLSLLCCSGPALWVALTTPGHRGASSQRGARLPVIHET